jgi:glutaredoxin
MGKFWPSWLRWRNTPLAHMVIVLYTRPGCHLCNGAKELLDDRRRRWGFQLLETNFDTDAELANRYGECVPVVMVDGKVRFRGRVEPALLDRLLLGIAHSAPTTSRRG